MVQTSGSAFSRTSDLKDLPIVSGQTMVQKWPNDPSSHKTFGAVSEDLLGGTGNAEDAKLPGAGIISKQCPMERAGMETNYEPTPTDPNDNRGARRIGGTGGSLSPGGDNEERCM
jgi:hypothetical protein